MSSIWRDPEVQRIHRLNRVARWHRKFARNHVAAGDHLSALHCEQTARVYFELARRRFKALRDQRRRQQRNALVKTWIVRLVVGLFFVQVLFGIVSIIRAWP